MASAASGTDVDANPRTASRGLGQRILGPADGTGIAQVGTFDDQPGCGEGVHLPVDGGRRQPVEATTSWSQVTGPTPGFPGARRRGMVVNCSVAGDGWRHENDLAAARSPN